MLDVLGFQEGADRARVLVAAATRAGYYLHQGEGQGRSKTGLLVNLARFRVVESGWWHCHDRKFVGPFGAGPSWIDTKWIAWCELEDLATGLPLVAGATHLVPSVQKPPFPGRTKRRALYRQHIARAVEWVAEMSPRGPVFLTGDFNATPNYPDLQPLLDVLSDPSDAPTHGNRKIDYVLTNVEPDADEQITLDLSSDHRAYLRNLTIKETA